jgi:tetratricopeptide (TPR) repeat protein
MNLNTSYTKCPKCDAKYSYADMTLENTSGAEIWSDGFCMAPMRKDIIKFAKCPACNTFFWLQENSLQGLVDLFEIKNLDNSLSLDNISKKELDFFKEAFRSGFAKTPEKEILLRIKLWHVINHIIRKYDAQGFFQKIKHKIFETPEYKESQKQYHSYFSLKQNNLIRLANLLKLDKKENTNYLLFAEIYRELGDFKKSMIFCYKAETSTHIDSNRINQLKQYITNRSKMAYKL